MEEGKLNILKCYYCESEMKGPIISKFDRNYICEICKEELIKELDLPSPFYSFVIPKRIMRKYANDQMKIAERLIWK